MIKIEFKEVKFWGNRDEEIFFKWLRTIKSVKKIYGVGRSLFVELNSKAISREVYRELFFLCKRYRIKISSLKSIESFLKKKKV